MKCSYCERDRVSRCSYSDCPFEVEEANDIAASLRAELAASRERERALERECEASMVTIAEERCRAETAEAKVKRLRAATIEECAKPFATSLRNYDRRPDVNNTNAIIGSARSLVAIALSAQGEAVQPAVQKECKCKQVNYAMASKYGGEDW